MQGRNLELFMFTCTDSKIGSCNVISANLIIIIMRFDKQAYLVTMTIINTSTQDALEN